MKFLEKSDLPDDWDDILPKCQFFRYKFNYSPIFCLFTAPDSKNSFLLVAREDNCVMFRDDQNTLFEKRFLLFASKEPSYECYFDKEELEEVEFKSLDGCIVNDFKAIQEDKNPIDEKQKEQVANMIFTHWDKDGELINNFDYGE